VEEKVRAKEGEFFDRAKPPAGTMLLFEGLPSLDATVAVEVMAAK
jgi:enamine deaminase RidA (YjgF/YER057c/UK114 family)